MMRSASSGTADIPLRSNEKRSKRRAAPKPRRKNDAALVAKARELRDRWLERVNSGEYLPQASGKYDLRRCLPAVNQQQLLDAA